MFELTPGRSQTYPQSFLGGYRDFVHADAYGGYNAVHGEFIYLTAHAAHSVRTSPSAGRQAWRARSPLLSWFPAIH